MMAALFVEKGGAYYGLTNVDPWPEDRDARLYSGPHPCVAHPPCGQWGVWARQGWTKRPCGDDDGCFKAALEAVRRFGGVLEHPAHSPAWKRFGLIQPPMGGCWVYAGDGGWTCTVWQNQYGHRAPKPTYLYASGVELPSLRWGKAKTRGNYNNISTRLRVATPPAFRDILISIAESARRKTEAA